MEVNRRQFLQLTGAALAAAGMGDAAAQPARIEPTNPERLSSGILVGREPHEPTFTRNGKELWVTLRGEDRIAIIDLERRAIRLFMGTLNGPAQVWFSADGALAFVASQKVPSLNVI